MLRSMTGFGRAQGNYQTKKVSIEIRSLNSKSMDLNLRLPSDYKEMDAVFRKAIANKLGRGKVDCSVSIDSLGEESSVHVNKALAAKYYAELKAINDELSMGTEDYLSLIMRMPDVLESDKGSMEEEEKNWLVQLLNDALENLNSFRRKEGEDLEEEFRARIADIRKNLDEVPQYEEARIQTIRERMQKALEDIDGGYDENRFEQELIFYIEKLDISEEKMRLSNHLDYFIQTMEKEAAGKKLGFITQEIGREINTLGSKSNNADMQKLVIGMKDALEKIKEQILNTL